DCGNIVDQDRGADALNFLPRGRREHEGVSGATDGERQSVDAVDRLRDWKIDEARWLLAEAVVPGVLDHADNFVHQVVDWVVCEPYLFPDGICIAEIESGGGLV